MATTPMFSPDGSVGDVPTSRVPDAIKAGFKVGVDMLSPDGKRGTIPQEKMLDAAAAGFRPVAPVSLPKDMGPSYVSPGVEDLPSRIADMTPQQRQRLAEGQSLTGVGETLGAVATGGLLPAASGAAGLAGRAVLSGAGVGAGALAGGASPKEAGEAAATGAVMQPVAEGVSAAAKNLGPKIAESALNITDKMRGRGRTIGEAVLEETTGIKASTLAPEIRKAIGTITQQMEDAAHGATQAGAVGSTQAAHNALNDAIDDLPRNARSIREKLGSLHDLLDLSPTPTSPVRGTYTPDELLEMKRGIGKEIGTWPAEWQKSGDVQAVKGRLYGAIDGELDRLIPGNAEKNQIISSLIPAKQQATRISGGASIAQRMAHRMIAHTGALTGTVAGGAFGYEKGGGPGMAAGAAAGMIAPELIGSSTGQMIAARLLNALGDQATSPNVLPLVKALAAQATQAAQSSNPGEPFHPGAGVR